ncbi:MAG: ankyrin repeat domain-containing protein, partial [Planctomycetota bacterium]
GHLDVLNLLLESGASPDATAAGGLSALMLCALGEHSALAECLLQAGASVDARDGEEQTALMLAAHHGRLGLIETLLEAGADPRLLDREGRGAREHAELGEQPAVLALFAELGIKGAPRPAPTPETDAARRRLRGLEDYFGEGRAVLVRAPVGDVAQALAAHRGGQHHPKVTGHSRELPAGCLRLTAFDGVPWTVIQHESDPGRAALGEDDAAALSTAVAGEALYVASSDEAGTLVFRHFRDGHLHERLDYDGSGDEDLDETRYWRADLKHPLEIDDPYDFTDARLQTLEAYVPAALEPGRVGKRHHVAAPAGVERIDWVVCG